MLEYLKQDTNVTTTENGALTHVTTQSHCLDLFATIGALRHAKDEEIRARFHRAFAENKDLAMRLLFFARDIRGGLGERRTFRVILDWLARKAPASVRKNLALIAEYGRFDDLLVLMDTPCEGDMLAFLKEQLLRDLAALEADGEVSLLGKWLPSVNASNKTTVAHAKRIARYLGMSDATYRRTLVALRARIHIIENNLREHNYTFDYEKLPSKALYRYRAAFFRQDGERYTEFLRRVREGKAVLHASTLMPYELVDPYISFDWSKGIRDTISEQDEATLNATWASLPDFGTEENALAVIDTSGSMYCFESPTPAAVALSLGIYFAERNTGIFHNHFIEFSARPRLIEIRGESFVDRLRYLLTFNEVANTDIEAVFRLILETAVQHKLPQSELPTKLIFITDMEFDAGTKNAELTNFENARRMFESHGYKLPAVVFWNVNSYTEQQPVTQNEQGVALLSGCTPRLFQMVASGTVSPYAFMLDVLGDERYAGISA